MPGRSLSIPLDSEFDAPALRRHLLKARPMADFQTAALIDRVLDAIQRALHDDPPIEIGATVRMEHGIFRGKLGVIMQKWPTDMGWVCRIELDPFEFLGDPADGVPFATYFVNAPQRYFTVMPS